MSQQRIYNSHTILFLQWSDFFADKAIGVGAGAGGRQLQGGGG